MAVNCKCSKNLIFSACKWKFLYRSNTVKSAMILNRVLMFWLAPVQTGSLNHNDSRCTHTYTFVRVYRHARCTLLLSLMIGKQTISVTSVYPLHFRDRPASPTRSRRIVF